MPPQLSLSLIKRFFKTLADHLDQQAYVLLTGAAAGNILGKARPSSDIDFEIRIKHGNQQSWIKIEDAVQKTILLAQARRLK